MNRGSVGSDATTVVSLQGVEHTESVPKRERTSSYPEPEMRPLYSYQTAKQQNQVQRNLIMKFDARVQRNLVLFPRPRPTLSKSEAACASPTRHAKHAAIRPVACTSDGVGCAWICSHLSARLAHYSHVCLDLCFSRPRHDLSDRS